MNNVFLVALLACCSTAAMAEKADSLKQTNVKFDTLDVDDVTQTKIMTGVVLTRGSLIMKADKALLREDADGNQFLTLSASPGSAATFRQKRDGGPNLWVEGQAQRIEYDEGKELVKLFSSATIKQLDGAKVMSEIDSEFISYDSRKEFFVARNDASGESKPGKGRGTLIMESRQAKQAAGKQ